jgi:hypothetical protein
VAVAGKEFGDVEADAAGADQRDALADLRWPPRSTSTYDSTRPAASPSAWPGIFGLRGSTPVAITTSSKPAALSCALHRHVCRAAAHAGDFDASLEIADRFEELFLARNRAWPC